MIPIYHSPSGKTSCCALIGAKGCYQQLRDTFGCCFLFPLAAVSIQVILNLHASSVAWYNVYTVYKFSQRWFVL
jgi:hypothetical protein